MFCNRHEGLQGSAIGTFQLLTIQRVFGSTYTGPEYKAQLPFSHLSLLKLSRGVDSAARWVSANLSMYIFRRKMVTFRTICLRINGNEILQLIVRYKFPGQKVIQFITAIQLVARVIISDIQFPQ